MSSFQAQLQGTKGSGNTLTLQSKLCVITQQRHGVILSVLINLLHGVALQGLGRVLITLKNYRMHG